MFESKETWSKMRPERRGICPGRRGDLEAILANKEGPRKTLRTLKAKNSNSRGKRFASLGVQPGDRRRKIGTVCLSPVLAREHGLKSEPKKRTK